MAGTFVIETGASYCDSLFYKGIFVNRLSAVANYGYHFSQWSDGDTCNPRIVTLTQDTTFTALFAKNLYTLTVLSDDSTLGVVSGTTTAEYLDTVIISATAIMPHYHFVRWNDGNTDSTRSVIITCDSLITAFFAIDTHMVTLAANNDDFGSVFGAGGVTYGSEVIIEAFASEGHHFAEWSNGSRQNPGTITVTCDTSLTAIFIDDVVPQICMVTVQDGHNAVLWEKDTEVSTYNIYREGIVADLFELVAVVPYDSLSAWVDTASSPSTRSYRYSMTATDLYGYEAEFDNVHKTMHLTINKGIGNSWNLVWTNYEGADYTSYIIYRGTSAIDIQQIDMMASSGNTSYTDENAPTGNVYYQVGVVMSSPCNPSKSTSISLSNIATNNTSLSIRDVAEAANIKAFSKDGIIVVEGTSGKTVHIFDISGRMIYKTSNARSNHEDRIGIPVPSSGVYLVKVGEYPIRKVVVVK